MTTATYNGWTNRETWAVSLHLMDTVVGCIIDDLDRWTADDVDDAAELFKDFVAEMLEDSGIATYPLLWDLLDLTTVNYKELGEHALQAAFN